MKENLKDILSNLNPEVDQETLLLYLQGKLSAEQQHEVEKHMMQDEFDADAFEGLQNITDKKQLASLVEGLKKDLRKRTDKKKKFREKLRLKEEPWIWITIVIVLMLVVLSFLIIHKMKQG
jgi:anti-sigma factor RsiW